MLAMVHACGENGSRTVTLTLTCETPRDLTLFFRATSSDGQHYDFADGGSYSIQSSNVRVDGKAVDVGLVPSLGQAPSSPAAVQRWLPGQGMVPVASGVGVVGSSLVAQLDISATLRNGALGLVDAGNWNSAGYFETAVGTTRDLQLRAARVPGACKPILGGQ